MLAVLMSACICWQIKAAESRAIFLLLLARKACLPHNVCVCVLVCARQMEAGKALDIVRAEVDIIQLVADVHCIIAAMMGNTQEVRKGLS